MAFAVGTSVVSLFQLSAGFFVKLRDLPALPRAVQWVNPQRYAYSAAVVAELDGHQYAVGSTLVPQPLQPLGALMPLEGADIIADLQYDVPGYAASCGVLLGFYAALQGLTYVFLTISGRPKTPRALTEGAMDAAEARATLLPPEPGRPPEAAPPTGPSPAPSPAPCPAADRELWESEWDPRPSVASSDASLGNGSFRVRVDGSFRVPWPRRCRADSTVSSRGGTRAPYSAGGKPLEGRGNEEEEEVRFLW